MYYNEHIQRIDSHLATLNEISAAYEHLRKALALFALGKDWTASLARFHDFEPRTQFAAMFYYANTHAQDLADLQQRYGVTPFVDETSARATRHAMIVALMGGGELDEQDTHANKAPGRSI